MDEKYHIKKGLKLNFCLKCGLHRRREGSGNPLCSVALMLCTGLQGDMGRAASSGPGEDDRNEILAANCLPSEPRLFTVKAV